VTLPISQVKASTRPMPNGVMAPTPPAVDRVKVVTLPISTQVKASTRPMPNGVMAPTPPALDRVKVVTLPISTQVKASTRLNCAKAKACAAGNNRSQLAANPTT
jgi:hypothetical protein